MKRILYISPHDYTPPKNGGQLRIFHTLKGLSESYEIFSVFYSSNIDSLQSAKELLPKIRHYQITPAISKTLPLNSVISLKWKLRSIRNTSLLALGIAKLLEEEFKETNFDYVFFEHLESLVAAYMITKQKYPNASRIINLHNIDHELWYAQYLNNPGNKNTLKYSKRALSFEKKLYKKVHLALVCSQIDSFKIEKLNCSRLNTLIVPNGTSIPGEFPWIEKVEHSLLFVGALDYFPNIEGLKWFYYNVWPILIKSIPDCKLEIVGRGDTQSLKFINHPNISIIGFVNDISEYYFRNKISIVPLLHGSGTRLKIPEAMAHNVPVVSTSKGAEGTNFIHYENIMLSDTPQGFAECIVELNQSSSLYSKIANNAHNSACTNMNWSIIIAKLVQEMNSLAEAVHQT